MSTYANRLQALRDELKRCDLDGFVVPLTDEHMSEYVGAYARRLAWLTGFQGSAGSAAVLMKGAAIFTDGRYTVQVREQVDGDLYSYEDVPKVQVADWLEQQAEAGMRIGYDPWLHTRKWVNAAAKRLKAKGVELVPVEANPVDNIWRGQPGPSEAALFVHDDARAGRSSAQKRTDIGEWLRGKDADAAVIAALDSIAWLFNIRGADVPHTPVALGFAIVRADASATLYVDPGKLTDEVKAHLGEDVETAPRAAFAEALAAFDGKTVIADPETAVAAIFRRLDDAGAAIVEARDPAILAKARKNAVEIEGARAAHVRDGAALTRFLKWFDAEATSGELDELKAAANLEEFRRESNLLRDLSFDTISAAGPHAALPHYRVSEDSNRRIEMDSIYLVDSGGQYPDGTTDVTRTIIIGTPTAEMKDRFTRVLKGHIALATAIFPDGTRGSQLDSLARQYLWRAGLDYGHGTGHGVGSFLGVHEGPQRISAANYPGSGFDEPLRAGMILSNEPGYYKTGEYGIRIENLVIIQPMKIAGAEGDFLGFETITFAPIDLDLIDPELMTPDEIGWLNAYHEEVREKIGPQLKTAEERSWLQKAAQAI